MSQYVKNGSAASIVSEKMIPWLPSIAYPVADPTKGFWHPQTSTLNWCEEDYYATYYAAEIVNTLTNLLFMWLGIKGIRNCLRYGHDRVYLVSFLGYLVVGTGSFLFHSTLKYPMQLVDELSMIYSTAIMCYACFSFNQTQRFRQILAAGLVALCVFITAYYHYLKDPTFHQNAYAILTAVVVFRSMYVMEVNLRPGLRAQRKDEGRRQGMGLPNGHIAEVQEEKSAEMAAYEKNRDEQILRDMWKLISFGLAIFLGGFAIWTLDNEFCGSVRTWRRQIGLPWGILLEGHGWWHLMTGTGAYMSLVWGIWLRHCLNGKQEEYELNWPCWWRSLPEIASVERDEMGGRIDRNVNRHLKTA